MIVAVTGANGFIGRHLCSALRAAGHETREIVRAHFATDAFERAIAGADVVIHAAAATRAPTRAALRQSNVELTRRVAKAARDADVKRLVLVSSQAAAGPASSRDKPVREDDPPAPIEEYGRTKLEAESIVRGIGAPFTIMRPAAVYGPGDRDFAVAFALIRRGIAIYPGNRDQWISLLHVHDCVQGIIAAATRDIAIGRTYFLANDEPMQWSGIYAAVRGAQGKSFIVDAEIPRPLVRAAALVGDAIARATGRASLLTSEKVALSQPRYWICSNERAKTELSFSPSATISV
jgi:nucleoside-diphosphate-sugar epimerase